MLKSESSPIIYSADWCGYCTVLKNWLDSKNIAYEVRDVDDPVIRKEMNNKTNGNQTIPVLFVGEDYWINPSVKILAEQFLYKTKGEK